MAVKLGLGGDLFGAVVVHAAKELVDLGLVFIAPGLECQDRDVVGRVAGLGLAVGGGGARGRGANTAEGRVRSPHLGLEVAQAEALDVGEAAVGVDQ